MDFALKRAQQVDSVESDDRGRVPLNKAFKAVRDLLSVNPTAYDVYVDAEGRIMLDPRVSIPAREAWLLQNPTALTMLKDGLQSAADGKIVDGPQFTELADEDE